MFDLTRKSAIVTGGARGIGQSIAMALAKQGADVAIIDLRQEQAEEAAAEIRKLGRKSIALKCDVSVKAQVDQTVKAVNDAFGKVDIMVNNAGFERVMLFKDTTPEFWDQIINTDYKGCLNFTRAVMDGMVARNYGRIINIGSDAGRVGSLGEGVYSGAKGAVIAFGKTMARELARYKVTVNCVCPGFTDTPMMSEIIQEGGLGAKLFPSIERVIPLGRKGIPEDIAYAVVYFASDEAGFTTGQTLSVSGGLNMV